MNLSWQLKKFDDLSLEELYNILRLRQEVFIVEQDCPFVDTDGKDAGSYHLSGFAGSDLAAYARLVPGGLIYAEPSIGRVITSGKYRRAGYGKLLMEKAIIETERLYGKQPFKIGGQLYLKRFYESFGFRQQGDIYIE